MVFFKKYSEYLLLGIVFLLALSVRIYLLPTLPNGLQQDELNAGYQGYKIILTGRDFLGNFLPFFINRFGDFRPAGIFYVDGLSVLLLGLSTFAIRFPSALFGALTSVAVYFFVRGLFKNSKIALLSAVLLAISPWHIVTSRSTSEQVIALFLMIVAATFLVWGMNLSKRIFLLYSGIIFLGSYFFYHTPRVFIPIFVVLVAFLSSYVPERFSKKNIKSLLVPIWVLGILLGGVTIALSLTTAGVGRLNQTSVWGNSSVNAGIKALDDSERGNIYAARVFDNKLVVYGKTILDQYLTYFSPEFLYIKGGVPDRYVVPQMGLFYYLELPFLLMGFYFLIKRKDPMYLIPLLWLLVGPIATSITLDDVPNIQRSLFMLPAFQIIEGYGMYYFFVSIKKGRWRIILGSLLSLGFLLSFIYFWHLYQVVSPDYRSYVRDDGNQELFSYLTSQEKNYRSIYLSSSQELPLYYSFFNFKKIGLVSDSLQKEETGITMQMYHFIPDECPERKLTSIKQGTLVVDFGNCAIPDGVKTQKIIYRQDSTKAYIINTY